MPNAFGVPCLRGGVVGGGSGGATDEYLVIESGNKIAGLAEAEKFHVDLLFNYARSAGGELRGVGRGWEAIAIREGRKGGAQNDVSA